MSNISNVSLYAFRVSLRWAMLIGKYPQSLDEVTKEQWEKLQAIADECDRRMNKRYENNKKSRD